ncbi:MAG: hypothetical protein JNL01_06075 [Bdellovibrionales bacterium]|nr:hypothetical protein [Bdellovibrionales bacterium]
MKKPGSFSPVLYDYLKRYQDDPTSRVFAPLAEAYRKAGLLDEAIEIARDGLAIHPHFVGGRVALARALFDKGLYQEVVDELTPIIADVPDNLVAQRLLGDSCLVLGRIAEALGSFKMLLYYNPSDPEVARMVRELESKAYENGALVLRSDMVSALHKQASFDPEPPAQSRDAWARKIERLQGLLLKVERYRSRVAAFRPA